MKFHTTPTGTAVYSAPFGRGRVIKNDGQFVTVKFDRDGRGIKFTADGRDAAGNKLHFFEGPSND